MHKTADEMRMSDWSSDVCSADLIRAEAGTASHIDREMHSQPPRGRQGINQMGKGRTAGQIEVTSFRIVERRDKAFRRLRDHSCDCLCTEAGGIDDEPRLKRRIRLARE